MAGTRWAGANRSVWRHHRLLCTSSSVSLLPPVRKGPLKRNPERTLVRSPSDGEETKSLSNLDWLL